MAPVMHNYIASGFGRKDKGNLQHAALLQVRGASPSVWCKNEVKDFFMSLSCLPRQRHKRRHIAVLKGYRISAAGDRLAIT